MRKFLILFMFASIFVSCNKKDQSPKKEATPQSTLQRTMKDLFFEGNIQYNSAREQVKADGTTRVLIPYNDTGNRIFRYILGEYNEAKAMSRSLQLVSKEKLNPGIDLFSISMEGKNNLVFLDKKIESKYNKNIKIIGKQKGTSYDISLQRNPPPICENPEQICTEWYWIVYNTQTGQIIDEEYLYTTCALSCEQGGGGGGTGEATECPPISMTPASSKISVTTCGSGANSRTKCYVWKIYTVSGGTIPSYWVSNEQGTQSLIGGGLWQFDGFTHQSVNKIGTELLYSSAVNNVSAVSSLIKSGSLTYNDRAQMHLTFDLSVSAICDGLPVVFSDIATPLQSWGVNE